MLSAPSLPAPAGSCCHCTETHTPLKLLCCLSLCVADVVVGIHGAQLYNALFMPAHKALVEVRPYGFWGVSHKEGVRAHMSSQSESEHDRSRCDDFQ